MRKITIVIICLMLITTFSWIFPMKITVADPPYKPSNPDPENNSFNVSIFANLSWSGGDPDEDPVTYDVYFGNESPPGFKNTVTISKFTLGSLLYNTRYYWKIVANDSNSSTSGDIWTFKTEEQTNLPPNTPDNPNPVDDSSGISIDVDLSWSCSDPDNDTLVYDVYFDDTYPPSFTENVINEYYTLEILEYGKTYYWKIVAKDSNNETSGPIWSFQTNRMPFQPENPFPLNQSMNVSINADLSWICSDPDNDSLTYDVYFGDSNPPPNVENDTYDTSYNLGTLNYTTTYYWRIIAWDDQGASTIGPLWSFTTGIKMNHPPNIPNNPSPSDGYLGTSIDVDLSWSGGDPDGDPVLYDVYFGTQYPPPKSDIENQSGTTFDPGPLSYVEVYYWKIVAWDNSNVSSTGPIWNFTTRSEFNRPPNIPTSESPRNGSTNVKVNSDISWVG
ncbi:MAG: hypothetical protein MUC80_08670, partial [Candidatus Thermoplasmatota archaeon]|nr:hypothetical protein [Candidatus Thermoplasmatota archaeon]